MSSIVKLGGGTTATNVSIPEYTSDPASPDESAWVLHTVPTGAGSPYGLLLALTKPGAGIEKWELSYRSPSGGVKRVELI
jgi:hypothetical protein